MSLHHPALPPAQPVAGRGGYTISAPFRHYRALALCGVVIVVLVIGGGLAAANSPAWTNFELSIDRSVSDGHLAALDWIAVGIAWLLAPAPGVVLVAITTLVVLWRSRDWITTLTFFLVVAGGWLSSELVKLIVGRARPDGALLSNPLQAESSFDSFPSGHTCLATALVLGTILLFRLHTARGWMIGIGSGVVLVVAWSRVYVGAHYPLDVLGAIVHTTAVMLVFLSLWNRWVVPALARWRAGRHNWPRPVDTLSGEY